MASCSSRWSIGTNTAASFATAKSTLEKRWMIRAGPDDAIAFSDAEAAEAMGQPANATRQVGVDEPRVSVAITAMRTSVWRELCQGRQSAAVT